MPPFNVRVEVFPKPEILDPEASAIEAALPRVDRGLEGRVSGLRIGQLFEFTLDMDDSDSAEAAARRLAGGLLANTVLHEYRVSVEPAT